MKKLFLVSAIVLSLGVIAPVFAAETSIEGDATGTETGTMDIIYGVESGYTVTIPANLNLTDTNPVEKTISAENVMIDFGTSLKVSISSENYSDLKWYMVDTATGASSNKVEYSFNDL